jgi:chromosome segregation ATPase
MDSFSSESSSLSRSSLATPKACRLQAAYNEVVEENTRLHSQFERALPLQEQWEQTKTENKRLVSQLTNLKSERDDLQNRLDLSLQANRDLTARLSDEKRSNASQRESAVSAHARELEKLRAQNKTQIDTLASKLDAFQETLDQERVDAKLRERTLVRLVRAAERYFGDSFGSAEDLLDRLEHSVTIEQQMQEQELTQQKQKADQLVRKLKVQRREDAKRNAELQRGSAQRAAALDEALSKAESQAVQLQRRIVELETEKRAADARQRADVGSLQAKVEGLSSELATAQATVRALQEEEIRGRKRGPSLQGRDSAAESGQATAKVNQLLMELRDSQTKKEELTKALHETELDVYRLERELERKKGENESLELIHSETVAELKSLRESLGDKYGKDPAKAHAKAKSRISKLQKALEEQTQQTYALETTISKQNGEIQEAGRSLRALQEEKEELEKAKKEADSELRAAQVRITELSERSIDSILPPEAFQLSDGDPALSSALLKIGSNQALQPNSKVKAALKIVRRHYDSVLATRNEALDQALSENQTLSEVFDRFLVDISIAATDSSVRLAELLKTNVGKSLVKHITQLRSEASDLRHEIETKTALLRLFSQTFKNYYTTDNDIAMQITEVIAYIDRLIEKGSLRSRQLREAQAELSALKKDSQTKPLAQNVERLENQLQSAIATAEQRSRDLSAAEATIECLRAEIQAGARKVRSTVTENQKDEIDRLTAEVNRLTSAHELLSQAKDDDEQEIAKLEEIVQSLKDHREQDSDDYQREALEKERATTKRLEEEKTAREASFQRLISELQDQLASARNNNEKLTELRNETEAKLKAREEEIAKLEKEGRRTASQIRSLRTQIDHDRKVADSALQAAKTAAEREYHAKLAEQLSKAATEKRTLLTIGIDAFRGMFNPSENLTEQTFRSVLARAREELNRLVKSDHAIRKMLGPGERQTTEDAVAQVLLQFHD